MNLQQQCGGWLKAKALELFGERCDDFYPGCPCCEAWRTVDLILDETEVKPERKKPCE